MNTRLADFGVAVPHRSAVRQKAGRNADRPPLLLATCALFAPVLVIPTPLDVTVGVVDLLLPILIVVLITRRSKANRGLAGLFAVFAAAAAVTTIAYVLVSSGDNGVNGTSNPLLVVRMFAIFLPMLIVLTDGGLNIAQLRRLLALLLIGTMIACAIGMIMHGLNIQVRDTQQRIWNDGRSSLRAGGLLGNSGDMGHIAVVLGATACSAGFVHLRRHRWLLVIAVLAAAYVTYISSSRAALVSLLTALLFMSAVYFQGRRVVILLVSSVLAVCAGSILISQLRGAEDLGATVLRFDVLNLTGQSQFLASESRFNSWERIIAATLESPFIGIGYDNGNSGDNSFLTIFAETGLFSGALYAIFWLALLVVSIRLPRGAARVAAIALVMGELVFMSTIDSHRMWASTPVMLLAIAVAIRLAQDQGNNLASSRPKMVPHAAGKARSR